MSDNMNRPKSARLNKERKTVNLMFAGGAVREFYLRGGICWPMLVPGGGVQGFAMLAGYDIDSGVTYIFEQHDFIAVDHVVDGAGVIISEGLSKFFNNCWASYFVRRFYWHDSHETYRKYGLQIRRSNMIQVDVSLLEVDWQDDLQPLHSLFEMLQLDVIKHPQGGKLDIALKRLSAEPDMKPSPEVRALMACVAGMEKHPWKVERYGHRSY